MIAAEVYELVTQGGATDFARLVEICKLFSPYCLIGGLAVNCYVEPVYTLDADLVVVAESLPQLATFLQEGFQTQEYAHSLHALTGSKLRVQFTKDERYQAFLPKAVEAEVLGEHIKVACLEDVAQGRLWAYLDPQRRLSKREKDRLDLIRLVEAYPALKSMYPEELVKVINAG